MAKIDSMREDRMKQQKDRTLAIGSYSSGTLCEEDLIPCFLSVAESLRLSVGDRATVRQIRRAYGAASSEAEYWDETAGEHCSELFDILGRYTPDYCYFGASEGDGADYGCWPSSGVLDGSEDWAIYWSDKFPTELRGSSFHAERVEYREVMGNTDLTHWLHVNAHGNATLYRRAGRRWIEVWAVV
jgi:hypothetical protein